MTKIETFLSAIQKAFLWFIRGFESKPGGWEGKKLAYLVVTFWGCWIIAKIGLKVAGVNQLPETWVVAFLGFTACITGGYLGGKWIRNRFPFLPEEEKTDDRNPEK